MIKLYRNHNSGFCFEFLRQKPELVRMLPVCFTSAATGVLCFLMTKKGHRAEKAGYALIVSGALSNLCDRLKRGYVVDYFSFQPGFLKKIVFNIGDLCIAAGGSDPVSQKPAGKRRLELPQSFCLPSPGFAQMGSRFRGAPGENGKPAAEGEPPHKTRIDRKRGFV